MYIGPKWLASLASNHRLSPLCGFNSHKWRMLKTCPNMTLAVEWDVKPKLWLKARQPFLSLHSERSWKPISLQKHTHPSFCFSWSFFMVLMPAISLYCIVYLNSAQYLHVLQESKRYMTHPTVQVQSNSQITDIPLTERQRLKDEHLSTSLRFFNLQLGIGPKDRGPPFQVVIQTTIYLPVHGFWTTVLCVPRWVCYPLGHSGR